MNKSLFISPIHISVYDRPHHFFQCIESLLKNPEAQATTVYVSSDGPRDEESADKVKSVRDYISSISGFKKIYLFAPKENTNGEVLIRVSDAIRSDSKQYIFSEDDNIFSSHFLSYMNESLDIYRGYDDIFAVCGYMFPGFPFRGNEQIFLRCFAGWGVGYWSEKNLKNTFDDKGFASNILNDRELFTRIISGLPVMGPMLRLIAEGKIQAGDITRTALLFRKNQVCVYPPSSLVKNIGNDGSGKHCGIKKNYANQSVYSEKVQFNLQKSRTPVNRNNQWLFKYFGGAIARRRSELILLEWHSDNKILKFILRTAQVGMALVLRLRNCIRKIFNLPLYD